MLPQQLPHTPPITVSESLPCSDSSDSSNSLLLGLCVTAGHAGGLRAPEDVARGNNVGAFTSVVHLLKLRFGGPLRRRVLREGGGRRAHHEKAPSPTLGGPFFARKATRSPTG